MKKSLIVCVVFIFAVIAVFFGGCDEKLNNLKIANYLNYESIAVGTKGQLYTQKSFNALKVKNESKNKPVLIGKNKNGYYEQIVFEGNKGFTDKYNVSFVQDSNSFLFIGYTKNYDGPVYKSLNNSQSDYRLVLDKRSGKLYDITDYEINIYSNGVYGFTDDAFYCLVRINNKDKLFKFSVVDEMLQAEELFDYEKVGVFNLIYGIDRYGNIYFDSKYMLTANGQLIKLNGKVKLGMNNIAYIGDQWVNSDGELEPASFVPNDFTNLSLLIDVAQNAKTFCIYEDGNTSYYRLPFENNDSIDMGVIYKYEFLDNIRYTVQKIKLSKFEKNEGIILKDRIYFQNANEVYYVNIKDGSYNIINSEYVFNTIYSNNQGEIIFEGVDSYLNDVVGVINYDNSITVGVTQKEYNIFYEMPIN